MERRSDFMTTEEKLAVLEKQEKELVFDSFSNHDALELGKTLADKLVDPEDHTVIVETIGEILGKKVEVLGADALS